MKNKLQKIIKHIKTMFYNISLCVSLKKDSTNVEKNKKNSKFVDNFDYNEIILKYYNGDKHKFMCEKTEYNKKLDRIRDLVDMTKSRVIGYSEFVELQNLLDELNIINKDKFDEMLSLYKYDFEKLYENIVDDEDKSKIDKIKTSEIIGNISGSTLHTEYKFINDYSGFLKNVKREK